MKLWFLLFIFLVGIGVGLFLYSVAPKYLGSYFPKMVTSPVHQIEGTVVRKQNEADRVLLTVSGKDGAILATFQKRVAEVSLLIEEGDFVTLDVRVYAPFLTDPPILRVKKPQVSSLSFPPFPGSDSADLDSKKEPEAAVPESPLEPSTSP